MTQDLFYDDLKITEIKIIVTPEQKKITKGDNEGKTYYIASFEYEKAEATYLETVKTVLGNMEIYRSDTIRPTNDMIVWENFPNHILEQEKVNGEEEKSKQNYENLVMTQIRYCLQNGKTDLGVFYNKKNQKKEGQK